MGGGWNGFLSEEEAKGSRRRMMRTDSEDVPLPPLADPDDNDGDGYTILDDGLSVCDYDEELQRRGLTSSEAAARRRADRTYRRCTLFLLSVTFLISVVVATVRYYRNPMLASRRSNGGPLTMDDNGLDADANDVRLRRTLEYLVDKRVSDPQSLHPSSNVAYDPSLGKLVYTPEYRAALWIAQFDQFRIRIPSSTKPDTARGQGKEDEYPFLQRYSLAVLFFATGGLEHWTWKVGFLNGRHECDWNAVMTLEGVDDVLSFGTECDGAPDVTDGRDVGEWEGGRTVTGISLPPFNNMRGTLPPEVHHLRYLKRLRIRHNDGIGGTIPFQYGYFPHLRQMNLAWNSLSGKIPRAFDDLTTLTSLRLEENRLTGDTAAGDLDFLRDLTDLQILALDHNYGLRGTFPESVTGLSELRVLNLANTNLGGRLPSSLANLTRLQRLHLDDCNFFGSVEAVGALRDLTHLYLEDNAFDDTVHDGFLSDLTELVHLDLSNCTFKGWVPGHFFALENLKVLDMSNNHLQDDVLPAEAMARAIGNGLEYLSLHGNNITGPIPPGIKNLENLTVLDLSMNKLTGEIPVEMGWLTRLEVLFLGRNDFDEGPLDDWGDWLRKMSGSLRELSLKGTNRNGTIPGWLREFDSLQFLDLGENGLGGEIPQSLEDMEELIVLILNRNRLEGQLGLGGLKNLETILIDDNDLTGDTDAMCAHKIVHFVADCARGDPLPVDPEDPPAELRCDCCSLCCRDANATCNDAEWLGNNNGVWEFGYQRVGWNFEEGWISPLLDYNYMQSGP